MNTELDSLELRVESSAQSAASGLDKLIGSLTRLKSATKGITGLTRIATGLDSLNKALSGLQVNKKVLGDLRSGLSGLASIKTHLTPTANQINKINAAIKNLTVDEAKIQGLVTALNGLGQVQKAAGLTSVISALRQIPKITKELSSQELQKFALQIRLVTKYLTPLATEMEKVSRGFSQLPRNIQRVSQSTEALSQSNQKAAKSFSALSSPVVNFVAKIASYRYILQNIVSILADSVMSINEYVENVNLFQVSMGEFYDEAFAYAQLVNEKLGVDPSQWMRTQGVFMSIANGFGVSRDQAYALSEGLTELSYDLSSLYNEDVESSALRLQSALAGEIEPIRRLGISITEATLQEFAMSKGIDESVESMTEQEKALLRTLKLMEGASQLGAIGDFSRTLESPANALRVLNQQLTQLSRALGSVLLPVLIQVLPYVQAFVSILTDAISALAALVDFEMPQWDASSWGSGISSGAGDISDALDSATKSAKELKDATLGIDELNIIPPNTGSGAGSGVGSNWAADLKIPDVWDQAALSQITTKADEIKSMIQSALDDIFLIISGAALVVGTILVVSGADIPKGLALMAAGAAGLAVSAAMGWGTISGTVLSTLGTIMTGLGAFALPIGLILAISGASIPLGIALMAAGAVSLIAGVALNWNGMSDKVAVVLSTIATIVGGALLAVGALLTFSAANIPLGLALMAAGAATLGSTIALNWSAMDPELKASVSRITLIVSGALLALGALLTFTGLNPALGLPLMVAGAATLAATTALNWGAMDGPMKAAISTLSAIAGAAFLVLGAIFTFTGANPALGIPLMVAGAAGLATSASLNWNYIVSAVTDTLASVGHIVGLSLISLGAILLLSGVGAPLGLGMIVAGGLSLASSIALNWDTIVTSVKTTLSNIGSAFMGFVNEWLNPEKWLELGKQAINGLFQGLSNIVKGVASWGADLINGAKDALGIHSPSTEFRSLGEYSTAGFVEGFSNTNQVAGVFDATLAAMSNSATGFSNTLSEIGNSSLTTFASTLGAAVRTNSADLNTMTESYRTMASGSNAAISSIINNLNAIPRSITTTHTIVTEEISDGTTRTATSVQKYATGGFPEYGQLFIAQDAGPELVGTIGRQTAVANTQQIVDGISAGVSEANAQQNALLREQNELLRAILAKEGATYLDGKVLLRSIEKASRNTGVNIMSGGVV